MSERCEKLEEEKKDSDAKCQELESELQQLCSTNQELRASNQQLQENMVLEKTASENRVAGIENEIAEIKRKSEFELKALVDRIALERILIQ